MNKSPTLTDEASMSTQETNRVAELERKNADLVAANYCLLIDELISSWQARGNEKETCDRRIAARLALENAIAAHHQEQQPGTVTDKPEDIVTNDPDVSSEHIEALARMCKLIGRYTTSEYVRAVVGFGHVLLKDKAVQERFIEANRHLFISASQSSPVVPECSMLRKFDKPATLSQYGIGFYEGWNAYHDELTKTPAAAPSAPVETKEKP